MAISSHAVSAEHSPANPNTSSQSTTDAWFTLTDVVLSQFSPDGRYLAIRTSTHFRVYDTYQETPAVFIETEADSPHYFQSPIAFSPDGRYVAINIPHENPLQTVRIWDITTGDIIAEITQDFYEIDQLAFSPTEPLLIIPHGYGDAYWEGVMTLWDFDDNVVRHSFQPGGGVGVAAIRPDGEWALLGVGNGTGAWVLLYNLMTGEVNEDIFNQMWSFYACPASYIRHGIL